MPAEDRFDFDSLWDYDQPEQTEARFRDLLPDLDHDPPGRRRLLTQIARAQGLRRRFADAHRTLDEVAANLPDNETRTRIRYLLERGRVYNSQGEPESARPFFEEAYSLASTRPAELFYAVDAAHMLAIIGRGDDALQWNLRALALAAGAADEHTRGWRGSLLNNIGWAYFDLGEHATALDYLQQALDFRREQGAEEETRIARWCVARVQREMGRIAEALPEQQRLLVEYETLGQTSGYVFEEIGECYLQLGEPAAARPYFEKAYDELARDKWVAANEPARLERLRTLGRPASTASGPPDE